MHVVNVPDYVHTPQPRLHWCEPSFPCSAGDAAGRSCVACSRLVCERGLLGCQGVG
jgi:hypothetical protein